MKTIFFNKVTLGALVALLSCTSLANANPSLSQTYESMLNITNAMYNEAMREQNQGRMSSSYSAKVSRNLSELQANLQQINRVAPQAPSSQHTSIEGMALLVELAALAVRENALFNISAAVKQDIAEELAIVDVSEPSIKRALNEIFNALRRDGINVSPKTPSYRIVGSRDFRYSSVGMSSGSTAFGTASASGSGQTGSSSKPGLFKRVSGIFGSKPKPAPAVGAPPIMAVVDDTSSTALVTVK